jgi:DtxR family transcriptional regulator, Mn-dependent transcriptional regulator
MKYSASKENYLKAIFHLQQDQSSVSTNAVADALKTKPASVTDMLKKLKAQRLLQYEKYRGVRLTPEGRKIAVSIIRKHRLWELFLTEKLGFGWEEVHEIAEELEHISSKKLIDRLDQFLDYPAVDPHGDPIPDMQGKMRTSEQLNLADLPLNTNAVVSHISDASSDFIELLTHKNISMGTRIEVKKKFEFDGSLEVKVNKQPAFTISNELAKSLFVKSTETERPAKPGKHK